MCTLTAPTARLRQKPSSMSAASKAASIAAHPGTTRCRTHKSKLTERRAKSASGSSTCSVRRRMRRAGGSFAPWRGAGESQDRFAEPRLQCASARDPGADRHRMRADKTKPRRRHIRLQNGAHPATPVRDAHKTSLFEVPSSYRRTGGTMSKEKQTATELLQ